MNCRKCGNILDATDTVCKICGEPVTQSVVNAGNPIPNGLSTESQNINLETSISSSNIVDNQTTIEPQVQPVVNQPQPVEPQVQPVVSQPQPVEPQIQPIVNQPQPVEPQIQPVVSQPQPVEPQIQPIVNQPQPVEPQVQPIVNQPQPVEPQIQPIVSQPQPVEPQVQPVVSQPQQVEPQIQSVVNQPQLVSQGQLSGQLQPTSDLGQSESSEVVNQNVLSQTEMQQNKPETSSPKKNKTFIVVLIILIVTIVLIGGYLAYSYFIDDPKSNLESEPAKTEEVKDEETKEINLDSNEVDNTVVLGKYTFILPDNYSLYNNENNELIIINKIDKVQVILNIMEYIPYNLYSEQIEQLKEEYTKLNYVVNSATVKKYNEKDWLMLDTIYQNQRVYSGYTSLSEEDTLEIIVVSYDSKTEEDIMPFLTTMVLNAKYESNDSIEENVGDTIKISGKTLTFDSSILE